MTLMINGSINIIFCIITKENCHSEKRMQAHYDKCDGKLRRFMLLKKFHYHIALSFLIIHFMNFVQHIVFNGNLYNKFIYNYETKEQIVNESATD